MKSLRIQQAVPKGVAERVRARSKHDCVFLIWSDCKMLMGKKACETRVYYTEKGTTTGTDTIFFLLVV